MKFVYHGRFPVIRLAPNFHFLCLYIRLRNDFFLSFQTYVSSNHRFIGVLRFFGNYFHCIFRRMKFIIFLFLRFSPVDMMPFTAQE